MCVCVCFFFIDFEESSHFVVQVDHRDEDNVLGDLNWVFPWFVFFSCSMYLLFSPCLFLIDG